MILIVLYKKANMVINTHKKLSITHHTQKIPTTRLLCECELYAPSNYDNDPEMKEVMEIFDRQTSERFREYDERMKTTRQKCKDKCDEAIQKIILKDKMEKQMAQQLTTLETKIDTNDIPTCICEKSMAGKVEKTCLKCGGILGTFVPELGLIGGSALYATAQTAALKVGVDKAIELVGNIYYLNEVSAIDLTQLITPANFNHKMSLIGIVNNVSNMCDTGGAAENTIFCLYQASLEESKFIPLISKAAGNAAEAAGEAANAEFAQMTSAATIFSDVVIISVVAVVCISVILLIIYLILRYGRRKKMKKKLQYIKLLNE
ncbi:rifin [Plasmodium falciparum IGH-CR14]|uniref:Rifin n=1 Tax=Plasmodium falciparum IGH-CR14 TaxID=580059 RepID=A0A0L1IBW3_PLAFA|nr:rifin [Plasmodium falciparum IGH-CR14]